MVPSAALLVLSLSGCLERVTGEPVPLDPRFYAAIEAAQGDPGQGAGGIPFASYDGKTVTLRGTIVAGDAEGSIDLGVRVPAPDHPGGVKNEGKILLDRAGDFELVVPASFGRLELEALHDPDQDGPTGDDPYGSVWIDVADKDIGGITLTLEAGSFGAGGPQHAPAPPGAPGGSPGAPGGGEGAPPQPGAAPPGAPGGDPSGAPNNSAPPPGAGDMLPFVGEPGMTVTVSGTLICEGCELVDLDIFKPNPDAPGGREMLGKLKRAPGDYTLEVPRAFGPLLLEAFSDKGSDGPGPGDPMGRYADGPIEVGNTDISGVDITLLVTDDGKMPGDRPAPPPPQQPPPDR